MTETEFIEQAARILHPMKPMPVLFEDVLERLKGAADPEEVAELEKRVEQLEEDCAQVEEKRDALQAENEKLRAEVDRLEAEKDSRISDYPCECE